MSKFFCNDAGSVAIEYAVLIAIFCIIMYAALNTLFHGEI